MSIHARASHLVPWDAHLSSIEVNPHSHVSGQKIFNLKVRERYGLSIVAIKRADMLIVAPAAEQRIFPYDILLCFGTDEDLDRARLEIETEHKTLPFTQDIETYKLWSVDVPHNEHWLARTIRDSRVSELYRCIIVGIERAGERVLSPRSDFVIEPGDTLWIVGENQQVRQLREGFQMK